MLKLIGAILLVPPALQAAAFDPSSYPYSADWELDGPPVLEWPAAQQPRGPSISEPTANLLHDLHAEVSDCELHFNSSGNVNMAIAEFWPRFLAAFGKGKPLRNWVYTTTPPMIEKALRDGAVHAGELRLSCPVQVVGINKRTIELLKRQGLVDGEPVPYYESDGDAILVRKGNPKNIRTIWDLARPDVRVVTPHPDKEPAFGVYNKHIAVLAESGPRPPEKMDVRALFDALYRPGRGKGKWLTVSWIHHRGVPWSIAHGRGDAGVMFRHLALDAQRKFPDRFDVVPLWGTAENPKPAPEGAVTRGYLARLKGPWTPRQREAADKLVRMLLSDDFTPLLEKHGLRRPGTLSR